MMRIPEAMATLVRELPSAHIVSSCGYISRDLLATGDRAQNLYLVGSMGMAAPIASGVALAHPDRTLVALDGDGSFAMNPGATLVAARLGNLVHVVVDDGRHASTGGQATLVPPDPLGFARAAGYHVTTSVGRLDELVGVLRAREPSAPGATFVHLRCELRDYPIGPRVAVAPNQLIGRFRSSVSAPQGEQK